MAPLARELRKDLANKVTAARRLAEEGARKVIESLAVHNNAPWDTMSPADKKLRNRLRAHGRQLGDRRDQKGGQSVDRLVSEAAYEHWHGMLFARFLAENDLLMLPGTGTAITLDEVEEIAREEKRDWLIVVSEYAEKMLPQIFRPGDPVLEIMLPRETRNELEAVVRGLDSEVFTAVDSLGWVYQFWQADRKDEVNDSGNKIGADELPSVTQLFTEDYMVDFLLDNTLGAWHAGKMLADNPTLAETAVTEDELRNAVALPGCPWTYLRFVKKDGRWAPAAGTFDAWPKSAKQLRCLDPCMGSGHFVVAMFERLVALLIAEDQMDAEAAVMAVIKENLFGLEIDPRCTQIAAFNLALAAWRKVGHCPLPPPNLACSGTSPNVQREEWSKQAANDDRLRRGMDRLYSLFQDAPHLGSLIDPRSVAGDLVEAEFSKLQPLLESALAKEAKDDGDREIAVSARGIARAAEMLAGAYTLVATNVPYLGRGKQDDFLKKYFDQNFPASKADLATVFVERSLRFCEGGGTAALVTPQNWLFLTTYAELRESLLKSDTWNHVARLGSGAFETIGGHVVNVAMICVSASPPGPSSSLTGLDVSSAGQPAEKASNLRTNPTSSFLQQSQLGNPDARIGVQSQSEQALLHEVATSNAGMLTGDGNRFGRYFWETDRIAPDWEFLQSTVKTTEPYGGRSEIVLWENGRGALFRYAESVKHLNTAVQRWRTGQEVWGKRGIVVSCMGNLDCTLYLGDRYDNNVGVIVPRDQAHLEAIWAFCSSTEFKSELRRIDQKVNITAATFAKVPFDLAHWQAVAASRYPEGLPKPFSNDVTQWLFDGNPKGSSNPLHAAVARLLGYRWPRQIEPSMPGCDALGPDGLEGCDDGIVCLSSVRGEASAEERLRGLLSQAWGSDWNAFVLEGLLAQVDFAGKTLDDWLRNGFFEQHCAIFQARPFIWHVWDGRRDGFSVLVNYHELVAADEGGQRTLDKLIYTYLGAWIEQQEADRKDGVEGAEGRLASAQHLKSELEKIRRGEPPFDIFVRWKSLGVQPIGWKPDVNDGVRLNIRPFMTARPLFAKAKNACILRSTPRIGWEKDRGRDPERDRREFPWLWKWDGSTENFSGGAEFDGARWNDLHYSISVKQAAALKNEDAA